MLVPADAVTAVINFLQGRHNWPASGRSVLAGRFLQVQSTGGDSRDYSGTVNAHQITITAWGRNETDDVEPERAAGQALALLRDVEFDGFLGPHPCTSVEVLTIPYPDPDPDTSRARHSFTARLHLRATDS